MGNLIKSQMLSCSSERKKNSTSSVIENEIFSNINQDMLHNFNVDIHECLMWGICRRFVLDRDVISFYDRIPN